MSELEKRISPLPKKRGVTHSSITCAKTCLRDLEAKRNRTDTQDHAQCMLHKLENVDSDFKQYHYALIELMKKICVITRKNLVMLETTGIKGKRRTERIIVCIGTCYV